MICPQCSFPNTADQQFCGQCGAQLTQTTGGYDALARLGEVLNGRYRLIRMIGMGASGAVYRAEIEGLGHTVAVKILHPHISADPQARRRLENEARLASLIDHPNIVSIIDMHSSPELTYLVMEHLSGVSLDEVLAEIGHLGVRRAIHIVRQLLSALETSHRQGVLHRDLKPDNVYLTLRHDRLDFVKVVDFGLATLTHRPQNARITIEGHVCGTPGYMSPEQVRNMELSERSDLYAVGVILYECLTGINPFIGKSTVDTMVNQVTLVPKPPSALCKSAKIPLYLDALVMRALSKNAEERFASAHEFRQVLEGLVLAQAAGDESTRSTCPECGNTLDAGATHCSTCGHSSAPPAELEHVETTQVPRPEEVSDQEAVDPREFELAPTTTTAAYRAVMWDPPLAGRREELNRIIALFDEQQPPYCPRVLRIVAGAGLGKGRLVREAARRARKLHWNVVWMGQEQRPVAATLWPIRRAVRLLLGVPEGPSNAAAMLRLAEQAGFDMMHQQGLLELLGLREDPGASVTERSRRWALAWHEAVRCVARRERLLLIFQDLHLFDQPSQELVASLVSNEPHEHPVNVLVTHDPQLLLLWAPTEMMSLAALSSSEARTLARQLLERMDLLDLIGDPEPIVAASGGNPLLLIELVRLVAIDPSIRLPRTLPEVISQRISRLPAKSRMLLHHIAVLGRPAQPQSLLPMLDEEGGDELRALAFLGEQGFLVSGSHGWHLSHRIHREVAYASIPIALRQRLHAKAAQQGLEKHWPDAIVAHHLCESGAVAQAVPYLLRAGRQALCCLDDRLAGELFSRVLRLVPAPPREFEGERKPWLDAVLGLASAMRDGGDRLEAMRILKQAIATAQAAEWLVERQACEQLLGALRQGE